MQQQVLQPLLLPHLPPLQLVVLAGVPLQLLLEVAALLQ
jgi:hypothetical protein